jgi:hypothetical protein
MRVLNFKTTPNSSTVNKEPQLLSEAAYPWPAGFSHSKYKSIFAAVRRRGEAQ